MSNEPKWEATDASASQPATRTEAVKEKLRQKKTAPEPEKAADPDDEAIKAVEKSAPVVTFAQVAEKLQKAGDIDLLDAYADLIGEVEDAEQRKELGDLYRARREALSAS